VRAQAGDGSPKERPVACSKKKGKKPKPGGLVCKRCGVGAKKKSKLCKPARHP
jgi:hypothetical protein